MKLSLKITPSETAVDKGRGVCFSLSLGFTGFQRVITLCIVDSFSSILVFIRICVVVVLAFSVLDVDFSH